MWPPLELPAVLVRVRVLRVYVWHILEQQLDLPGGAMRIFLCYNHAQVVPQPH